MEKDGERIGNDIFILDFLHSELSAYQFLNEHLSKLNFKSDKNLEVISLCDYFKNKNQESVIKEFYNEYLNNIKIHPNYIKLKKLNHIKTLEYLEELKEDAFASRISQLDELEKEVLPLYRENYSISLPNDKTNISIEKTGFDYKGDFSNIQKLHKFLKKREYIEVEYIEFKKYFQGTFTPNGKRVLWLKPLNQLTYFIKSIKKQDKKLLGFNRKDFTSIIPIMFERKSETNNDKECVSIEQYYGNSSIDFETKNLDISINYLNPQD